MSILLGDFSYLGSTDSKGQIKTVVLEEALNQSIKLWIASQEGDLVNFPDRGGYIFELLLRPMKEVDEDEISESLKFGLDRDFFPFLEVVSLDVSPNYEQRYWEINAVFFSPELNYQLEFSEKIINQL